MQPNIKQIDKLKIWITFEFVELNGSISTGVKPFHNFQSNFFAHDRF